MGLCLLCQPNVRLCVTVTQDVFFVSCSSEQSRFQLSGSGTFTALTRAAQLIQMLSKYDLLQFSNRRKVQYLLKEKNMSKYFYVKYCGAAELFWPIHCILPTWENIFIWSQQKSHHNHFTMFFDENENNFAEIIILKSYHNCNNSPNNHS